MYNYNSHKPSWLKIIKYLGQITNIDGMPIDTTSDTSNKILLTFKSNIKKLYISWWENKKNATSKLDFYNKYKKVFRYE